MLDRDVEIVVEMEQMEKGRSWWKRGCGGKVYVEVG
jgi:hypothetical protein